MGKHEKMAGWEIDAIEQSLQKAAEAEQIPKSLHPKQMEAWLKEAVARKDNPMPGQGNTQAEREKSIDAGKASRLGKAVSAQGDVAEDTGKDIDTGEAAGKKAEASSRKWNGRSWWYGTAIAACLAVVLFSAGRTMNWRAGISDRAAEEGSEDSASDACADDSQAEDAAEEAAEAAEECVQEESEELIECSDADEGDADILQKGSTYKEVYQALCGVWEEQPGKGYWGYGIRGEMYYKEEEASEGEADSGAADGIDAAGMDGIEGPVMAEEPLDSKEQIALGVEDEAAGESQPSAGDRAIAEEPSGAEEPSATEEPSAAGEQPAAEGQPEPGGEAYGKTNQQEKEIEEADIIKNDGRYIYHVINTDYESGKETVQITDTEGGLKKAATIEAFGERRIQELYVWKDSLVVIEEGWGAAAENTETESATAEDATAKSAAEDAATEGATAEDTTAERAAENAATEDATAKSAAEDAATEDTTAESAATEDIITEGDAEDIAIENMRYEGTPVQFSRIHIYDIKERTAPRKIQEFTIKGGYKDSRISGGYLYFFAGYDAFRPRLEKEYKAYIPEIGNEPMDADDIYLPEKMENTSYLVMASINMEQPDTFTDTKAIVSPSERFYVTDKNIYVTNNHDIADASEGIWHDSTDIYRFSYKEGKIEKAADGNVPGSVKDHFAINEYQGYLRMATTVREETHEPVRDSVWGKVIAYDTKDSKTYNSLYTLDQDLNIAGKVEGLAEGETIYSARFIGRMGYFVTFRQTDPLFSVDLSDPQNPKVLGELKISGFSEYLHPYADHLLLGIGMEAEEDTGSVGSVKLTMFDTSNPSDVKEGCTLELEGYTYANALYDYKAILIDPGKNLFGFCAEGYSEDASYCRYLLFSYADGAFQKRMEIDCSDLEMDDSASIRGTYIGDVFYLTYYCGKVEAYSLADGSKLGEMKE